MRLSLIRIATLCTTVALLATTAHAVQPDKPDYGRPGWYAGVGAGAGWDFLEGAIKQATGGDVEIGATGTFNARGGYRVTSWFAIEGMYEGVYDLTATVDGVGEVAKSSNHSFLANFKLIAPIWRMHPYLAIGPGAQYGQFNDIVGALDTDRWDFVLRLGLGLDTYITENWLVNLEIAPSIRFTDYNNIPSQSTDNVSLTLSAGMQYRF